MSAITGSGDPLTISFSASAASWSGTAGRTISQPASLSSWIWRSVAFTSRVSVLRSEEHTSELQSHLNLVCRLLLEKKKKKKKNPNIKKQKKKNKSKHK